MLQGVNVDSITFIVPQPAFDYLALLLRVSQAFKTKDLSEGTNIFVLILKFGELEGTGVLSLCCDLPDPSLAASFFSSGYGSRLKMPTSHQADLRIAPTSSQAAHHFSRVCSTTIV